MNIYIVVIEDTHSDTEVIPFVKKKRAIKYAKKLAKELARHELDILVHDNVGDELGWVFYVEYSPESHIKVIERRLKGSKRSTDHG